VKLTLKVNLVQLFTATPTQFMLGDIRQGTTTNLTVQLKRLDGKKLELTKVQASGDTVAPQPPVLGTDESTATVELVVKAGADARRFNENVQFFASGGAAPAGFVQVFGRVVGDVTVNPERLIWAFGNLERLPASRLEGALTRQFIVTCNRADQKVELKNLTTTVKGLELKPTTLTEGQSYQVMAKFAQAPTDSVSGVVTFETGLASQPTITIPVSVNVVKQP
jgi:hypothetical protein